MEKECIFCKIANKEIPKELTYEDDNFIAFLDISPRAEGHTLIIPKQHFKTLLDLPNTLATELQQAIKKVCLDLVKKVDAEGFNIFTNVNKVSGQVVPHLHIHIVPRKENDNLKNII